MNEDIEEKIIRSIEKNLKEVIQRCFVLSTVRTKISKEKTASDFSEKYPEYYFPPIDCGHVCVGKEENIIYPYFTEQLDSLSEEMIITYLLQINLSLKELKKWLEKRKDYPYAMKTRNEIEKIERKIPEYKGKCYDCLRMVEYISSIEKLVNEYKKSIKS